MPESRVPFAAQLYIAAVIGFALGLLYRPQATSKSTNIPHGPFKIDELQWNEPTPLRDVPPPRSPPLTDFQFDWDRALLNLPVHRCRSMSAIETATDARCAYLNATHPVHPRDLLKQWMAIHAERPPKAVITELV